MSKVARVQIKVMCDDILSVEGLGLGFKRAKTGTLRTLHKSTLIYKKTTTATSTIA